MHGQTNIKHRNMQHPEIRDIIYGTAEYELQFF